MQITKPSFFNPGTRIGIIQNDEIVYLIDVIKVCEFVVICIYFI